MDRSWRNYWAYESAACSVRAYGEVYRDREQSKRPVGLKLISGLAHRNRCVAFAGALRLGVTSQFVTFRIGEGSWSFNRHELVQGETNDKTYEAGSVEPARRSSGLAVESALAAAHSAGVAQGHQTGHHHIAATASLRRWSSDCKAREKHQEANGIWTPLPNQ